MLIKIKENRNRSILDSDYYFKLTGCYIINNFRDYPYIKFREMTLLKCFQHCNYFNIDYFASGVGLCYCMKNFTGDKTQCSSMNQIDKHYYGNLLKYFTFYSASSIVFLTNL